MNPDKILYGKPKFQFLGRRFFPKQNMDAVILVHILFHTPPGRQETAGQKQQDKNKKQNGAFSKQFPVQNVQKLCKSFRYAPSRGQIGKRLRAPVSVKNIHQHIGPDQAASRKPRRHGAGILQHKSPSALQHCAYPDYHTDQKSIDQKIILRQNTENRRYGQCREKPFFSFSLFIP